MNPIPETAVDDDDEINLLDLLQVIMDNLRLLVIGPLVAGLLALGITFAIAKPEGSANAAMCPFSFGSTQRSGELT